MQGNHETSEADPLVDAGRYKEKCGRKINRPQKEKKEKDN